MMADDESITSLLARLDELVRWRQGAKGKYLDLHSALTRIQGESNHVITGRRGSGKTRLLDELRSICARENAQVVRVEAEDYKELGYPDILIQILRTFLSQFRESLQKTPEYSLTKLLRRIYKRLRHPIDSSQKKHERKRLIQNIKHLEDKLSRLLDESEELVAEYKISQAGHKAGSYQGSASVGAGGSSIGVGGGTEIRDSSESSRTMTQSENKRIKVERLLSDFKKLLREFCMYHNARIILAVDDFYFIRREDQPKIIDYIHRICKDSRSFLKVATIRHRTKLFEHSDIARGVVPGHEIQSIDLELPLGEFDSISRFLKSIWQTVCNEVGIETPEALFVGEGLEQAVLASGGVPRDFFGIVKEGLLLSRERRRKGVGKREINEAARVYSEKSKLPELRIDISRDQGIIELLLYDIIRFSRDKKRKNCFLVDLEVLDSSHEMRHLFDALVDSRLVHLIIENTSSSNRKGRFSAYLLDLGLYGHPERRGGRAVDEVKFWDRDTQGRLINITRAPIYPARPISELEESLQKIRDAGNDIKNYILEPDDEKDRGQDDEDDMQLLLPFIDEGGEKGRS